MADFTTFFTVDAESFFIRFVGRMIRHNVLVTALCILLSLVGYGYTVHSIRMNTDTTEMISAHLHWRQISVDYKKSFPQLHDDLVVVLDAETPDRVMDAAQALTERLKKEKDLFEFVFYAPSLDYIRRNKLLYLKPKELAELADSLAKVQPFIGRLGADMSLRGLFHLLGDAVDETLKGDDIPIERTLKRVNDTVAAHLKGQDRTLSWQELMSDKNSTVDDRRAILLMKPRLDFSQRNPADVVVPRVREIAAELGLTPEKGYRVRLTGGVALSYDELNSVSLGTGWAAFWSLVTVTLLLVICMRSLWLITVCLLTLFVGLGFTCAFATAIIGELNLISVAFSVFYIGMGSDYAIHYLLRYREFAHFGKEGIAKTGGYVGLALLVCSSTSAIGFYSFLPTDYVGVGQLGLFAGTGILISYLVSITFLPALLSLMPLKGVRAVVTNWSWWNAIVRRLLRIPETFPRFTLAVFLLLGLGAAAALPFAEFDHNPLHLQDQHTESVQTYREMLETATSSPYSISMILKNDEERRALQERLKPLIVARIVDKVVSIDDFVPEEQPKKLAILDDIRLAMATDLIHPQAPKAPPTQEEQIRSLEQLLVTLDKVLKEQRPKLPRQTALDLHANLKVLLAEVQALPTPAQGARIARLEAALLGTLPGRMRQVQEGMHARPVTVTDLPPEILSRWRAPDGRTRLEIRPVGDMDHNPTLERFVAEVQAVAGEDITDTPVINVEASHTIVRAFQIAFAAALVLTILVMWPLLRFPRDLFISFIPLLLSALYTGASSVIFHIPFNFANIIALPILLGTGVDSALHMVQRRRLPDAEDGLLVETGTSQGVIYSALTTIMGFCSLAVSPHEGTASMGIMLTLGMSFTLFTSMFLLPALFTLLDGHKTAQEAILAHSAAAGEKGAGPAQAPAGRAKGAAP